MKPSFALEPWTGDLDRAAAVLTRGFSDYPVPQREAPEDVLRQVMDHYIEVRPGNCFLARADGQPIGGIFSALRADQLARIHSLAVAPEWRRQGAGRLLVDACLNGLVDGGATAIHLEVIASNEAAIALYRSVGFEVLRELRCLRGTPPTLIAAPPSPIAGPPLGYGRESVPLHRDLLALTSMPRVKFAGLEGGAWCAWRQGVLLAAGGWRSLEELTALLAGVPGSDLKVIDVPVGDRLDEGLSAIGFAEYARQVEMVFRSQLRSATT